jgi:hypothetical protein
VWVTEKGDSRDPFTQDDVGRTAAPQLLLAADPDVYYVTDHYVDYNAVLVRLSRVNRDVLRDLLGMAYKFVTANVAPRSPSRKRRKLGLRK